MCFHKWTKWKEYEKKYKYYPRAGDYVVGKIAPIDTVELWQKRECTKCGYSQHEKICS